MTIDQAINTMTEEDWAFLLKNGKRSSVLLGYDFENIVQFSWKFLKEIIPDLVKKAKFGEMVFQCFIDRGFHVFQNDIDRANIKEVMSFFLWISDEREAIAKLEMEVLVSEPDMALQAAGISEMQVFGEMNTVDSLAGGDPLKYEEIKRLPYHVIFDKTLMDLTQRRIEKRYAKIKGEEKPNGRR